MFCPKCGKENPDGNAFCYGCGAELPKVADAAQQSDAQGGTAQTQAAAQPAAQPEAAAEQQPATQQPVEQQPQSQPAGAQPQADQYQQAAAQQPTAQQPTATAQPQPQAAPQPQPQPQAAPQQPKAQVYKKGCVASAWDDIKNSEGWFSRTLLMGLINIVPILNWAVPGYCMRWARQLPMGKIAPMPKNIFVNRGFINGVYWFVLSLVFGLVGGIAGCILGIVPLIGWIAGVAVALFVQMFLNAALMRIALADRLGAGFDLSAVWAAFKRSPGSLLCISIVPALIIGACVSIIALVIIGISVLFVGGDIVTLIYMTDHHSVYSYGYDYHNSEAIAATILAIIGTIIPAILICYVLMCFAEAFEYLLIFRAMGHWTARYASDWIADPTVSASAYLYPDQA